MKRSLKKTVSTIVSVGLLCLLGVVSVSDTVAAQKKSTRTQRKPSAKPTPTPSPTPNNLSAEAAQVAEQIRLITRFIYVYGKVANGLELAEEQAKQGEVSPSAATKNQQSKEAVVNNIRGLRTGLGNVVAHFQTNPRLQVQYLKVSYAAEAVTNAERLAASSKYDEAGKSLVAAVERLTEVLQALR